MTISITKPTARAIGTVTIIIAAGTVVRKVPPDAKKVLALRQKTVTECILYAVIDPVHAADLHGRRIR